MDNAIVEFLKESNNIENEWDDTSLAQAIYAWNYVIGKDQLTPGVVLKTHKILMLHQKLYPNEKGYFRKVEVRVGRRLGKPHYAVPTLIENWCEKANEVGGPVTGEAVDVLDEVIRADHIAYEEIHPFVDGNGRTGRIFMNWQRVKAGLPILVIKEKEKQADYGWFK